MRFWNGYQVKTLEERGWAQVHVTYKRIKQWDPIEYTTWLAQDRPGRYFENTVVDAGLLHNHNSNEMQLTRVYYFENDETATLFALKWA